MKDELQIKLTIMNENIKTIIKERKEFLDDNMHHFAEFAIDEEVYNCSTGSIAIVKEHYRYFANRDPLSDSGLDCDCRFSDGDNTSCYSYPHPFISKKDFDNKTEIYIEKLKSLARVKR